MRAEGEAMAARDDAAAYRFDVFRLDRVSGAVLGPDGAELHLRPKAFALLCHLLDNPGRLLGREELLDALWPGVVVTDDSLTQCVGALRHAFGERAIHVLRTVPKRGYVFVAEVRRDTTLHLQSFKPRLESAMASPSITAFPHDLVVLREDSVAVHRFETPDGNRACVLLADALASDLIAAASRVEGIRVRPTTADCVGEGYHVRGEVLAANGDLRIAIRLEEAATGATIWADRLDQPRDGPLGLSEVKLLALAAQLNRQVARYSLAAARGKPVEALSARELTLLGRDHHQRGTEADTALAKEMFARAIAADPDYAQAYAWQAYTVHRAITHGWGSPSGQEARDESLRLARRALQLDPTSPLCLARLAHSLMLNQRWEEAVDAARTALTSDRPAFAFTRITCCEVLTAAGHPTEAASAAQEALTLDPLPPPTIHAQLGRALLLGGKVEEALPPLRRCASHLPDYSPAYDILIVAAVETGRLPEALAARRELLRIRPNWTPRNHTGHWCFRRSEDLERFEIAHNHVASLMRMAEGQGDSYVLAAQVSGADCVPPHPRSSGLPISQRTDAQDLVALRQDALIVHPLRAMPDDAVVASAAAAATSDLVDELVRYEDLRVVTGSDDESTQGFAVRGDVRSADGHLRVHLRLHDLKTGTTFWTGWVEWASGGTTDSSTTGVAVLAATIAVQIGRKSLRPAREKPVEALTSRECMLLGKEFDRRNTRADGIAALNLFVRASESDPGYAPAHAWQALSLSRSLVIGVGEMDTAGVVGRAIGLARRAVELEPESPLCLASLALALGLGGHWDEAVRAARLALRTKRAADEGTRVAAGTLLAAAGYPEEAVTALRQAVADDPHGSPTVHAVLGRALFLCNRPEDALAELRLCAARLPDYATCFRTTVIAAIEAGLIEEARTALGEVRRLRPDWVAGSEPMPWFLRRLEETGRCERAFRMAVHLDDTAKAGGLMPVPVSCA